MRNSKIYMNTCLFILMTITSGCKSNPNEDTLIMEVNSLKVPCEGVGKQSCLQVKYEGEMDWQLFYSAIEGFDYEQGYIYKLKITKRKREKENMPMDVSAYTYHLKSVMKKTKDSAIQLNDIWGLKSISNSGKDLKIDDKSLRKGYPMLEINTRTMQFSGHDGCNTFSGSLEKVNQTKLVFGNAIASLMICENMEIPDQILKSINRVNRYELKDLQLTLFENDMPLLTYQKMD